MTRILMVCLGNICRSPLAHGILESKLPPDKFYIDSAGTASYHIGSQPDRRSITVGKQNNIDISHQSARQFSVTDFERFDIIYAMDRSNYSDILSLAQHEDHAKKVKLIMDENPFSDIKNVPDPYYGDIKDFEAVFKLLDETCAIIANTFDI
jgi:protein-tyrosine phosphatase